MSAMCAMPSAEAMGSLLGDLIGKPVASRRIQPFSLGPKAGAVAALFSRDDGSLAAACVFELKLAACAGAALTGIPSASVEDQMQGGKLGELLLENFREVLNIGSQLFVGEGAPRVKFTKALHNPEPLPADAETLFAHPAARSDYEVNVPGYGGGRVAVLLGSGDAAPPPATPAS